MRVANVWRGQQMTLFQSIGAALGRAGLGSLFLLGGANKIANFAQTAERMDAVGLAPTALLLPATIALELAGGAALVFKLRHAWVGALLLAAFTLATNIFFHRFWELSGEIRSLELSLFFKNIAIAGALLFAAVTLSEDRSDAR